MSDSDNYFSDSDKSITNDNINDNMNDPMYDPNNDNIDDEDDYGMDEETRLRIYYACLNKCNSEPKYEAIAVVPKKRREKNKSSKESSKLTLKDFIEKAEEPKVKKWSSSRFKNKKDELGITNDTGMKRCFSPRLPIPTQHTFKKNEYNGSDMLNNKSSEDIDALFPTLKTTFCKDNLIV
jgi:hypothetical protein